MSLGRAEGSSTAEATNADKSQSESSRKGGRVHSLCSSMEADAGRRVGGRRFVAYVTRFLRKPSRLAPSVLSVERTTKVFFLFPQKYVYPRNITRTIVCRYRRRNLAKTIPIHQAIGEPRTNASVTSLTFKETGYKCALVETSRTKLPPQGTWGRSLDKSCTETR